MASSAEAEQTVCVTGASGFIGSWIVLFLLQRGYHVRATVQNKGKCSSSSSPFVSPLSSYCAFVLTKLTSYRRGSHFSFTTCNYCAFVICTPQLAAERKHSSFTVCYCAKQTKRVDLLLASNPQTFTWLGIVNVQDVARAHILLFETPTAKGRHLCTSAITHFSDFADKVAQLYPQYNVYRFKEDTHPDLIRMDNPSTKLFSLGLSFTPDEEAIKDAVISLQEKGHLEA
ncbi:hypothetical protein L7F22_007519 [Adiantum nelumboides]|nr:hypothetical protein [Adiantum nelumboides]